MFSNPTRLAYWLLKDINKAIRDFRMIENGDRIGVAVSGGKDSLSLLRLLDWRRQSVPEKYELVVLHIVGDTRGPQCPSHPPLMEWVQNSSYEYAVEPVIIPDDETLPMNCQRCSRNRRRTLFQVFRQMGCNVISLSGITLTIWPRPQCSTYFLEAGWKPWHRGAIILRGKCT